MFKALAFVGLVACSASARREKAPLAGSFDASTRDAAEHACGAAICAAGEFCEERYKGHDLDEEGRPLDRLAAKTAVSRLSVKTSKLSLTWQPAQTS